MKPRNHLFLLTILLFGNWKGYAQFNVNLVPGNLFRHTSGNSEISSREKSVNDSVYFDLSEAYQINSVVDIPIYFRSPNTVNSIDFAVRYNNQKAIFDSIIVQMNNLQFMYYYNPQDTTLRFTSNSLSPFTLDSAIAIIRLQVLSGPFCSGDFYDVETWMNGDACSNQIINCVISDVKDDDQGISEHFFPNPASDYLNISSNKTTEILIIDVRGKLVQYVGIIEAGKTTTINTSTLSNGIYFVQFKSNQSVYFRKLIIDG